MQPDNSSRRNQNISSAKAEYFGAAGIIVAVISLIYVAREQLEQLVVEYYPPVIVSLYIHACVSAFHCRDFG